MSETNDDDPTLPPWLNFQEPPEQLRKNLVWTMYWRSQGPKKNSRRFNAKCKACHLVTEVRVQLMKTHIASKCDKVSPENRNAMIMEVNREAESTKEEISEDPIANEPHLVSFEDTLQRTLHNSVNSYPYHSNKRKRRSDISPLDKICQDFTQSELPNKICQLMSNIDQRQREQHMLTMQRNQQDANLNYWIKVRDTIKQLRAELKDETDEIIRTELKTDINQLLIMKSSIEL